jgi:hypothetical protein
MVIKVELKKKLRKLHDYLVIYITQDDSNKMGLKYGDEVTITKSK